MKFINLTYLIDDDPILILLTQRMLARHGSFNEFLSFGNAQLALDHLHQQITEQAQLPDMILLDLNMPVMDGWEFLDACSHLPQMQTIPVFILSSSIDPADLTRYKNYSNVKAFFSKPLITKNLGQILAYFAE